MLYGQTLGRATRPFLRQLAVVDGERRVTYANSLSASSAWRLLLSRGFRRRQSARLPAPEQPRVPGVDVRLLPARRDRGSAQYLLCHSGARRSVARLRTSWIRGQPHAAGTKLPRRMASQRGRSGSLSRCGLLASCLK